MHKRQHATDQKQKYFSYEDFCKVYGISLFLARKFAKEHNLAVRMGRRVLIDIEKADKALKAANSKED